jgi:two-component system, sensor histidine kinase and response regulator
MTLHNRILVVDDHPTNLAVLEELLGETYPLTLATSGEAALALAEEIAPALILLDVMMPGIDGYETCRRLRKLPLLHPPKILMVSAKAMVAERLRGYDAGADDYVTKPFDPQELLAKVRVYLQLRSSEEVDQLKSHMLALLNHEMRTPLNGLIAPLQLLRTDAAMAVEERQLLLEMAAHSATRLERLCEKVATLSAMHAGHWDVQCVTVDLREVVRSALEAVSADAAARSVTLVAELPEAALTCCDLRQMREVILTLLDNAIRFSPHSTEFSGGAPTLFVIPLQLCSLTPILGHHLQRLSAQRVTHAPGPPVRPAPTGPSRLIFRMKRPTCSCLAMARRLSNSCVLSSSPSAFSSHTRRAVAMAGVSHATRIMSASVCVGSPSGGYSARRVKRSSRCSRTSSCATARCDRKWLATRCWPHTVA